jgi:hypothetical protein
MIVALSLQRPGVPVRLRASSAVAAAAQAVAGSGRPKVRKASVARFQADERAGVSRPGWRSASAVADVPYS